MKYTDNNDYDDDGGGGGDIDMDMDMDMDMDVVDTNTTTARSAVETIVYAGPKADLSEFASVFMAELVEKRGWDSQEWEGEEIGCREWEGCVVLRRGGKVDG